MSWNLNQHQFLWNICSKRVKKLQIRSHKCRTLNLTTWGKAGNISHIKVKTEFFGFSGKLLLSSAFNQILDQKSWSHQREMGSFSTHSCRLWAHLLNLMSNFLQTLLTFPWSFFCFYNDVTLTPSGQRSSSRCWSRTSRKHRPAAEVKPGVRPNWE